MAASPKSRATIAEFETWMRQAGIWWNDELIAIEADRDTGAWRVAAQRPIVESDLLAAIPKASVLSARNSSIADVLVEEGIGAGLALTIAAMHEHCLGERSKWCARLRRRRRRAGGVGAADAAANRHTHTHETAHTQGTATCALCRRAST
jgi:hypothetical protein